MDRINSIKEEIYPYKKIADIGCDHGYLIIEAFKSYNLDYALAIDNKKGPLDQAINNINKYDFKDKVRFILSSGIKDITDDCECVVIAGMGGILISDILNDDFKNVKRFVIEPNRDIKEVRIKMVSKGFYITNEKVVFENDKFYEIITFEKGVCDYTDTEYEFGPILLKNKDELFILKYQNEIKKLSNIYEKTNSIDILNKIERIKSICL